MLHYIIPQSAMTEIEKGMVNQLKSMGCTIIYAECCNKPHLFSFCL